MTNWRKTAIQSRSKETEKALSRAARDLLNEKSFTDIRVDEVARNAGMSVGGYYARFKGKSALLHLADIDFLDACVEAFDDAIPEDFAGNLSELLRSYITVMVHQFGNHREAILQIIQHAAEDDSSEFRRRATEFNDHVHGRLRRIMSRNVSSIAHPDPERAANMAIFIASASARDAVLRNSLRAYPIELSEQGLVDELVLCSSLYLTGQKA